MNVIKEIFRAGRFKPLPTLWVTEISGGTDMPVEAMLTDAEGNFLGYCWQADLEELMALAKAEKDTVLSNPNIHTVTAALEDMKACRKSCAQMAIDIARQRATTVIPFPGPFMGRPAI
jgi:hypothetical protein